MNSMDSLHIFFRRLLFRRLVIPPISLPPFF